MRFQVCTETQEQWSQINSTIFLPYCINLKIDLCFIPKIYSFPTTLKPLFPGTGVFTILFCIFYILLLQSSLRKGFCMFLVIKPIKKNTYLKISLKLVHSFGLQRCAQTVIHVYKKPLFLNRS